MEKFIGKSAPFRRMVLYAVTVLAFILQISSSVNVFFHFGYLLCFWVLTFLLIAHGMRILFNSVIKDKNDNAVSIKWYHKALFIFNLICFVFCCYVAGNSAELLMTSITFISVMLAVSVVGMLYGVYISDDLPKIEEV
jgi:hypothetical protein